jgi:hypothetical protein
MQMDMCEAFQHGEFSTVDRYVFVGEAWFAVEDSNLPPVLPARRVDRKEGIIVLEYNRHSNKSSQYMQEFSRQGKKIILKNPMITESDDLSRMNFFRPYEDSNAKLSSMTGVREEEFLKTVTEKIKKAVRKEFDEFIQAPDDVKFKELIVKMAEVTESEKKRINSSIFEDVEKQDE